MRIAMNLLLLLSALLSALTGVSATERAPQPARVAAEAVSPRPAEAARRSVTVRPANAPVSLIASARAGLNSAAPLIVQEPIWANRRRE